MGSLGQYYSQGGHGGVGRGGGYGKRDKHPPPPLPLNETLTVYCVHAKATSGAKMSGYCTNISLYTHWHMDRYNESPLL